MKLAFFVNYLNHHQVLVADELYRELGEDFCFVATYPRKASEMKGGVDYSRRPYCIPAADSEEMHRRAMHIARTADVAVISGGNLDYEVERAKVGKLTLEMSERWLKKGWVNILSPLVLKNLYYYYTLFRKKPVYKLCCSGFAAGDCARLGTFAGRCYKWGYFTGVPEDMPPLAEQKAPFRLMWCARFLKLKHPELPLQMALLLKGKGYRFTLDMYGDGSEYKPTRELARQLGVEDMVHFKGSQPNDAILRAMREHDIFLFTSNQLEGWGAVVNESMAQGCVPVVSDAVGCARYLIKEGETGFCFPAGSAHALSDKVRWLLDHPRECMLMRQQAYRHMRSLWNPRHAATALLSLCSALLSGQEPDIPEGPGSKA